MMWSRVAVAAVGAVGATAYGTLLLSGSSWRATHLLLAKGFALTNAVAALGLFVQRRGYAKVLTLRTPPTDADFLRFFLACALLLFGCCETLAAAYLSFAFRRLAAPYRPFTGLQMFHQLPEATAVFALGSALQILSDLPLVVLQQFLLLRLMLGGGLGKMSNGNWLSGEAMLHHYWTTPLPNCLSPVFHTFLPASVHRLESWATLAIEGWPTAALQLAPWQACRTAAAAAYGALLLLINLTGSYGHLGLLSLVQCCSLLDDGVLSRVMPGLNALTLWVHVVPELHWGPAALVALAACSPYLVASLVPFVECASGFSSRLPAWWRSGAEDLYTLLRPAFILGKYVKFARVTSTRIEVILELTLRDGRRLDWPFKYKPTSVDAHSGQTWLMPGVDWQCWFVGLRPSVCPDWLSTLCRLALHADADALALLGPPPAALEEAASIRCLLYDYRYEGCEPRDGREWEHGHVWARRLVGSLGSPIRRGS